MYPPNMPHAKDPMTTLKKGLGGMLGLGITGAAILALLNALGFFSGSTPNTGGGGDPGLLTKVTFSNPDTGKCLGINGPEQSNTPLTGNYCDPWNPDPSFVWYISGNGRIVHKDANNGWFCIDLPDNDHSDGRKMQVYGCDWPGVATQQYFAVNSGAIVLADGSMCVSMDGNTMFSGAPSEIQIWHCTGDGSQKWTVNYLPMMALASGADTKPDPLTDDTTTVMEQAQNVSSTPILAEPDSPRIQTRASQEDLNTTEMESAKQDERATALLV